MLLVSNNDLKFIKAWEVTSDLIKRLIAAAADIQKLGTECAHKHITY